jgi:hypothetical protein
MRVRIGQARHQRLAAHPDDTRSSSTARSSTSRSSTARILRLDHSQHTAVIAHQQTGLGIGLPAGKQQIGLKERRHRAVVSCELCFTNY